jgi:hypothetical protein
MNAQYVPSKRLARYMAKYMLKKEPGGVFNININVQEPSNITKIYKSHIAACCMSSIEVIVLVLVLGKPIININTSITSVSKYQNFRTATVLPNP